MPENAVLSAPQPSAAAAQGQPERQSGVCNKWLDRGFGFITASDGSNYFVHQTQIHAQGFRSLSVGEPVEFDLEIGTRGKLTAVKVTGPGGTYVRGGSHSAMNRGRGRSDAGGLSRGYQQMGGYNQQMMYGGYSGVMTSQSYGQGYPNYNYGTQAVYGAAATYAMPNGGQTYGTAGGQMYGAQGGQAYGAQGGQGYTTTTTAAYGGTAVTPAPEAAGNSAAQSSYGQYQGADSQNSQEQ